MKSRTDWERDARERGHAAGNMFREEARDILARIEVGDTDVIPAPLSGEWAGESIPEIFGIETGGAWPTGEDLDRYEELYIGAWRSAVEWTANRDRNVTE